MSITVNRFALFAAVLLGQGCAVLPFAPTLAHVAPRILFPNHDANQTGTPAADLSRPDPRINAAVIAGDPVLGDNGVAIDQHDRVAFVPNSPGSIPLRVNAVDLVSDVKAHAVGDVITVNVVESVASESKAGTALSNQRSISAGLPNLFGLAETVAKHNPIVNLNSMVNGTAQNSTTGVGDMTAADTFNATVTAVVVAVNPSGTLSVRGERQLRVNGEDDTIHLAGVVRPQDIDSNDAISSAQVADLDLSITGQGQIRDKQGDGLGTRLLDWLWLF
jgi:flagellar L-ring protein precursor FlgH